MTPADLAGAPPLALAQAQAAPSIWIQLIPFVLIFVIMYFLIIRPQQKRMKEHQSMLEALRKGDEVVTSGGIIAKVSKVGDDEVEGEISDGVKVRIVKHTISNVVSKTEPVGAQR